MKINWIEDLLQMFVKDGRGVSVELILCPYFMKTLRLPFAQAFKMIREWSDKCDKTPDKYSY
jgi:hypothetical protein